MKVLIVGEGKHESGGALETFARSLCPIPISHCDFEQVKNARVHVHGKGKGYFKKAISWMTEAIDRQYDAIVLVIDQDKFPERASELSEAQAFNRLSIRRALGVAIPSFDAWILADEQALSQVLGSTIPRQPDPEMIAAPIRRFALRCFPTLAIR